MTRARLADARAYVTEAEKLEALYTSEIGAAMRLAYLITGDKEASFDIAHDAFTRLAARFGHLRDSTKAAAYLRRSVVNLANSHFRRLRTQRRWLARQDRRDKGEPAGDLDTTTDLWRLLHELPSRQRSAIVLRYYEDLSEQDVADILQCSVDAVKGLVRRGMAVLEESVRREWS